jgi:hypothetical protein
MSDIKFDGDWVIVEGSWLKSRTLDFMLDAPGRRLNNTGHRRALVHDSGDKLTINYNRDYPGGVNILGEVSIEKVKGHRFVINAEDIVLDSASRRTATTGFRRAMVHDFNDGLTINWASDYPGGVTINGVVKVPAKLLVDGKDIGALITTLQNNIKLLDDRVKKLELKK